MSNSEALQSLRGFVEKELEARLHWLEIYNRTQADDLLRQQSSWPTIGKNQWNLVAQAEAWIAALEEIMKRGEDK